MPSEERRLWKGPVVLSHMDAMRILSVYERNLALVDRMTNDEVEAYARLKIKYERQTSNRGRSE